jgi:hypothetical protein
VDNSKTGIKRLVVCEQNLTSDQLPSSSLRQQQTPRSFETPGTGYPGTQHHNPEDRNSTFHRCEKLTTCKLNHITRSIYLRGRALTTARTETMATILRRLEKTSALISIRNAERIILLLTPVPKLQWNDAVEAGFPCGNGDMLW